MPKKLILDDLKRPSIDQFKKNTKTPIVVVLENIRSLNNVGSFFRTADAFAITKLMLCGITGSPPNKDKQKTALGATDSVCWQHYADTQTALDELLWAGYTLCAMEQTTESLFLNAFEIDTNQHYALVFGNEVEGVSQTTLERCHHIVEIPQAGTKHSLNVAVSGGIGIWHFFNLLNKKKVTFQ